MTRGMADEMEKSMKNMEEILKKELGDMPFRYQEGLPDKISEEDVKGINEALAYFRIFKTMIMDWAEMEDIRYEEMSKKLDRIQSKIGEIDRERYGLPAEKKKCY